MLSVLAFLLVLGVLIFVHELGHLLAAKWSGMYVHRFSIGMGPTIKWATRTIGETEYTLSWLPLGGYVRVATGEEAGSEALEGKAADDVVVPADRLYENKPVWRRIIFVLGGIVFNLIFAWLVYSGLALKNGRAVDPVTQIGAIDAASLPAGAEALASIPAGTAITAIAGKNVASWGDITDGMLSAPGDAVELTFADGQTVSIPIHQDALVERVQLMQSVTPLRIPVVGELVPSKPAAKAGFAVGDTIVSINGAPVTQWVEVTEVLRRSAGVPLTVAVGRTSGRTELQVTPNAEIETDAAGAKQTVGRIGMGVATAFRMEPLGFGAALVAGGQAVADGTVQIWRTIKGMVSSKISNRELGGPILIGQLAGQSARLGIDALLNLMALLSVNLAVFNLLPVPVLDGGQLVFLVVEGVIRRPVPLVIREWAMRAGVAAVLLLMVFAFTNDIRRLLGV